MGKLNIDDYTKEELLELARGYDIVNRDSMNKDELYISVGEHDLSIEDSKSSYYVMVFSGKNHNKRKNSVETRREEWDGILEGKTPKEVLEIIKMRKELRVI